MSRQPHTDTHYIVKNLNGTSKNKCRCKSWLSHWKKMVEWRGTHLKCAVHGCSATAEVGAHVLVTDPEEDSLWWIAPYCKGHNHYRFTKDVFLKKGTRLAPANKDFSCKWKRNYPGWDS